MSSIRHNSTYTVYVLYSILSKDAATHLELCIQQQLHALIPGHLLNDGTDCFNYQHATVDYNTSSKVYRVYVTVLEGVRNIIDQGHVTMNYWQNTEDRIPKKVRTDTNVSLICILKNHAKKQWDGHWQLVYDRLVEYLRVNGHTHISSYDTINKELGL